MITTIAILATQFHNQQYNQGVESAIRTMTAYYVNPEVINQVKKLKK